MRPRPQTDPKTRYGYLAANLAVLWLAVLCYRTNHFYLGFLADRTQTVLLWLAGAYTLVALLTSPLRKDLRPSHAFISLRAFGRWLRDGKRYLASFPDTARARAPTFSKEERNSLLFLLLKIIYLPMMLEFLLANWKQLSDRWWSFGGHIPSLPPLEFFNDFIFPTFIDLFFITECAFYAFGYAVELPRLKNIVRSVEPTFLGWAVALACYPPFNGFVNNYVLWYTSDEPAFASPWLTCIARALVLACFAIYLWGAVSLGAKCSNLTNRGIVTTGAFAWVRHPAYVAKNLAWWIAIIPVFSLSAVLSMSFWTLLYFLRAITEERHLAADPDYVAYCQRVRYRFIPGLF
jgi:protein-S-isoprenylcysteine O-methyltransferase Ste14